MQMEASVKDLDSQLDRQRLIAASDQEAAAMSSGDIEKLFAILSDDVVFFPPNISAKTGEELRIWLREFLERVTVAWLKFTHAETAVAGDLAYHVYEYSWRVTPRTGGESIVAHGKGIHIFRRQPDGEWKITREMWNASPG
jgi:ketosteroid isomerase-like protein